MSVSSRSRPSARCRESPRNSCMISFRTSGSPPVTRIFSTPEAMKHRATRSSSSNESSSLLGRNVIASDMQYRHLRSQRSVTDSRRYFTRLPNASTNGTDIAGLPSPAAIKFRSPREHASAAASMSSTDTNFSLGLPQMRPCASRPRRSLPNRHSSPRAQRAGAAAPAAHRDRRTAAPPAPADPQEQPRL